MPHPGEKKFVAMVGEIVRVVVVQEGAGNYTFQHGKTPKNPVIVRAERPARCGLAEGDEFCVPAKSLHSNPVDANREAMQMAQDLGYDEDDEDEEDQDEEEEDDDADDD